MIVTPLLVLMIVAVILAAVDRPTPIGAPRFMDPHVSAYAKRIADALAHDHVPAKVPALECLAIADRYGANIPELAELLGPLPRRDLAELIAEALS